MNRILTTLWPFALIACAPDAPATPSFQADVMPILAGNCLRCHAAPVIGGAPEYFRLDVLEDVIVRDRTIPAGDPDCTPPRSEPGCLPTVIGGAATWAATAAQRVDNDDRPMPPRFRIDDHEIETLQNWADEGAPRGEPRPNNAEPAAAVESIERVVVRLEDTPPRAFLVLHVRVDDPDRDVVGGSLHARIAGVETFVGLVHSGVAVVRWETTSVAAGTYPLSARLDDGGAVSNVGLGTVTVEAP
ncbi:MAG: hypothetical protein H0T46_14470 [Deltaproteobacteria bacterium]|nr:hypothetical protein [Deltaproteobacteria bacterium]